RHTRFSRDWSSDVCSSDLASAAIMDSEARLIADSKVLVGEDVVITAQGDINLRAGQNENGTRDYLNAYSFADELNASVVPISDLESLGEVAVNHHVGVGSGSVLSSGGDVNLIADTLANRIVEAWGKGQSWLTAVAGALGGDSATAEQVGGTNLNSISASVR